MTGIGALCGAALCFACLGVVIKQLRPEFFSVFAACGGVVCVGYMMYTLIPVSDFLRTMGEGSDSADCFTVLLKAVGVSLLCGVASDICKELGELSLANGVESAGKAAIILLSLPVAQYLMEVAKGLAS